MANEQKQSRYWAGLDTADMLKEAVKRVDQWFAHVKDSGKLNLWRLALREYYAGSETGGQIGTAGEQGEFTTIKVNHYHNLGEHIVTAIAGQPPAFQPEATNNDHESTAQTVISTGLLDTAVAQKGLDEVFVSTTRRAFVLTEGYASAEWDTSLGEDVAADPDSGQIVKTGDVRFRTFAGIDMVRDYSKETAGDHEWYITRRFENRYNVAARAAKAAATPEEAAAWEQKVLSLPSKTQDDANRPRLVDAQQGKDETDDVAVFELRHAKSEALPEGRRCVFVSADVWLSDGPLPFRDLYVFRMHPEEQIGTERGYSQGLDLLAPQHAINASYSASLSGLSTLGHPVIWSKAGGNISVDEFKAFSVMRSGEKPESMSLLEPNSFKANLEFAKEIIGQQEILSGVNAVRRGNLDATGKLSGAAYALIDAKFLESVVGLQRSFKAFAARLATATIQLYQDFAKAEQTLRIVGKSNRSYVKQFTGDKLKKISRVEVEIANPLSRTVSGRLQLLEMLLKVVDGQGRPMIKTPEQIFQVITTGRLEPVTEGPAKELDNIKAENEMIADGQVPQAFIYDNHPLHMQEHYAVIASPEARTPGNPVAACLLEHYSQHLQLWTQAPIDGLAARGIQPAPSMTMAPPAPGGPTDATQPGAPGPTSSTGPDGASQEANMPSLPTNPETGEQAPGPVPM